MAAVTVVQVRGHGFRVETRGHAVLVDQPSGDGVELGPTPVELLVMSLASCAAHYAAGYLRRQGLPYEGLRVDAQWGMRTDPPRVNRVELIITPPVRLDAGHYAGMVAAVDECTVHNTLRQPPAVSVREPAGSAPGAGMA